MNDQRTIETMSLSDWWKRQNDEVEMKHESELLPSNLVADLRRHVEQWQPSEIAENRVGEDNMAWDCKLAADKIEQLTREADALCILLAQEKRKSERLQSLLFAARHQLSDGQPGAARETLSQAMRPAVETTVGQETK